MGQKQLLDSFEMLQQFQSRIEIGEMEHFHWIFVETKDSVPQHFGGLFMSCLRFYLTGFVALNLFPTLASATTVDAKIFCSGSYSFSQPAIPIAISVQTGFSAANDPRSSITIASSGDDNFTTSSPSAVRIAPPASASLASPYAIELPFQYSAGAYSLKLLFRGDQGRENQARAIQNPSAEVWDLVGFLYKECPYDRCVPTSAAVVCQARLNPIPAVSP